MSQLPEISFATLSSEDIEQELFRLYAEITGRTLAPGNPERLFIEVVAYREMLLQTIIDRAGKMNLLRFAEKGHLDHLGYFMRTSRLAASRASTTLLFTLAAVLDFAVIVPQGTRVTTKNSDVVFATAEPLVIPAGEGSGGVRGIAETTGTAGNGYVPGQLDSLVDPLPYVASVSNTTISLGGSDTEEDENYRERIRLAPESFSCAGPDGAYAYFARAAHADIIDAAVDSPEPGVVDVRPLLKNGELPGEEMLETVRAKLDARTIRPLTDRLLVAAPDVIEYTAAGRYWIARSDSGRVGLIKQAVESAAESYRLWQRSATGRDINPSRLVTLVMQAGAKRVELDSPLFTIVEKTAVAREKSFSLIFAGLEDD